MAPGHAGKVLCPKSYVQSGSWPQLTNKITQVQDKIDFVLYCLAFLTLKIPFHSHWPRMDWSSTWGLVLCMRTTQPRSIGTASWLRFPHTRCLMNVCTFSMPLGNHTESCNFVPCAFTYFLCSFHCLCKEDCPGWAALSGCPSPAQMLCCVLTALSCPQFEGVDN